MDFRDRGRDSAALTALSTVVALDVGGTVIKGALVDRTQVPKRRIDAPTPPPGDADALVAAIVAAVEELRDETAVAVGVAVPGTVDSASGVVRYAGNLGLTDLPLRALLTSRLPVPVALDQDGRAAATAELRIGAAAGYSDAVVIAIGTGIAGGLVVGGTVVSGAGYRAGELGHVPVVRDGEPCACGMRGCAEAYAGGASIARRYHAATGRRATAEQVFAAARDADADAQRVVDQAIDALATLTVGCIVSLDPDLVLVGGGLSRAGAQLLDPLRARVGDALTWRAAPPIEPAGKGPDAALFGAGLLAWGAVSNDLLRTAP